MFFIEVTGAIINLAQVAWVEQQEGPSVLILHMVTKTMFAIADQGEINQALGVIRALKMKGQYTSVT
mgnify:CR=1 FL=1